MFTTIHLIGCGGIGSILLDLLCKMAKFHQQFITDKLLFHIYDGDYYEDNNLSRQIFPPNAIGNNKAIVTAERIEQTYPEFVVKAYPEFLNQENFSRILENTYGKQLVIVAIDNEHGRHDIIKALDSVDVDFLCILPGNDWRTATCTWWEKEYGEVIPCHPFDLVDNFAHPTDKPRGNCSYEITSSPQLINANMAAALLTMEVLYARLEKLSLPVCVEYDGSQFLMNPQGKLKSYD